MTKKRHANADIRQWTTAGGRGHARKTNVNASGSLKLQQDRQDRLPTLNICCVIVTCPSSSCDFMTDVYGQGDIEMWKENQTGFPACPKCGNTLVKAKVQYRKLG